MTKHDDPGLFRPWRQDERPTWRVVADWGTPRDRYDTHDLDLLLRSLEKTGLARQVRAGGGDGILSVSLLVKAVDVTAAEHAAVRIVEVAHTVAGLGHLGLNLSSRATSHSTVSSDDS